MLPQVLQKSIIPGTSYELRQAGVTVLPRHDAVLNQLAFSDEREYDRMRTSGAISSAIEQRKNGLLAEGFELVPPEGRETPAAQRLFDLCLGQLKAIRRFRPLLHEMLDAVYVGWRPVELQWGTVISGGRAFSLVTGAVARDPWRYSITSDGEVVRRDGWERFPDPRRWLICTAGSSQSPYGKAWLQRCWLLHFLAQQFDKTSYEAMRRAMGILRVTESPRPANWLESKAAPDPARLGEELRQVMSVLANDHVLVQLAGWTMEIQAEAEAVRSAVELMEFFDRRLTIAIVGQNLTTNVEGGSYAAAKVHGSVLADFYRGCDSPHLTSWINDGLLPMVAAMNFGEVDPADMPRWRSRLESRASLDAAKLLWAMGAPVDGEALAEQYRVPVDWERGERALVRPERGGAGAAIGGQEPPTNESRERAAPSEPDDVIAPPSPARRARRDHFGRLMADWMEQHPDPKAATPE